MQCPDCNFPMKRHNAANISLWRGFFHHHMTPTLASLSETHPLQYADDFLPR